MNRVISYVSDKLEVMRLKTRYQRLLQEQMMELLEARRVAPVAEDPGNWQPVGQGEKGLSLQERRDQRRLTRKIVNENPHARNILRLLEAYVVGEGFRLTFASSDPTDQDWLNATVVKMTRLWDEFLCSNRQHFSYQEFARRVWRDGECFLRIFPQTSWPPQVRFIDPELIGSDGSDVDEEGIETEPGDVETVRFYLKQNPEDGQIQERIPAAEVLHCKYDSDANEKRGRSFFAALLEPLEKYEQWQDIELQARKLQSSIVLWRKVQGGPQSAQSVAAEGGRGRGDGNYRGERIRPGTILTTSAGTEIKYLQPDTNFGDAVPLGRMLLLSIAAGAGIPEFMLTSDAANGNYASTMVAEGPAVKLFQHEQIFFAEAFTALWRLLVGEAVFLNLLSTEEEAVLEPRWSFPQLVNRDRPRERQADVELIEAGVLSRAEVQRREHLDPQQIQAEIDAEHSRTVTEQALEK